MKIRVCLAGLDGAVKARIESFIRDNWPRVEIYSADGNPAASEGGHQATLTIVSGRTVSPQPPTAVSETIEVNDESVEQVLYLANAKLGRLTHSDFASVNRKTSVKSPVSRREFLLGAFGRSRTHTDGAGGVPTVSDESCEARFGCRKCVDICPAPGALEIQSNSLVVLSEHCVRCGLCAGVCPVAAIQVNELSENAYQGLLNAIQHFPAPKKTLVITCDEKAVPKIPWVDVEHVPGIGTIGVRQLAMAASASIDATIVYCPDGTCVGKEHVKRAVDLIASLTKAWPPTVHFLEGTEGAAEIEHIHNSSHGREGTFEIATTPWKSYVNAIENISSKGSPATGLAITDIEVAQSCTLCNACVNKCPHNALRIEGGDLIFGSAECTGCGYCEQVCPEHAITLLERTGSIDFDEKRVFSDEMVRCSKCNTPYASVKMVRKVAAALQVNELMPICPSCRELGMYDALFAKAPPKVVD